MVKRTRNASVDLGHGAVAPAVDDAPTPSLDQPPALGGELADGSSAQPTSPSSDPSALKRRRLTRSDSADKTPSISPTKAALATLEQVGEEPSGEQEQEQQDDPTDADLALLTALAQEHAAELDGILGEQEADGETSLPAPDAADVEDADDTRRLGPADAARLLKIYEAMTAGNLHLEGVLDRPPQAATDPAPQTTLRELLSPSETEPLRSAVQATLEALAGGEDASDAFYAQRVAVRDTADLKRARELAAFGRDAVRVLDGVGGGRKGKGVGKPQRKIALYQKIASHPSHPTQLYGPRYFTEPIEVDSDEEFEDTGYANVIEIHPSPELPAEQQPTLGQSSRPRQRRLKPVPATKEAGRLVTIIPRDDPFSSFLPSYDSSVATLSLSETVGRLRKAEAIELARDEAQAAPLPAWSALEDEPRAGEAAAESVDAMLKKNWERLARLKAAQVARVRKGLEMAVEDESATAQQLAETLARLIALRPSPSVVPSTADVRALHSIVGLDNPPPSYRGTLDGARQLALADNTTLKVVYAQPPLPAPPPQQQQQQQVPPASRQGSYGPAPTSGGQTYQPSPAQRAPSYPQQQQQQQPYQPSPRQGYGAPQSQGNSPLYATGSPYMQHQPPPPQWQQAPAAQSYRPPPAHQQQPLAPYASQQAYSQQQSAPIPMMGWKSGTSSATPLPPSVQAASSNYPEGMW